MSQASVKVSVVIPIFNTERYLGECLDSVLGQSLEDIEVLCVDDGSTDRSPEILRDYARRDPRVVVMSHGGRGPGSARNTAIEAASGEYIACVDSDDYIHVDMLAEMYGAAKLDGTDVVICMLDKFSDTAANEQYAPCTYDKNIPHELDGVAFSWRDLENVFRLRFASCNKIYNRDFLTQKKIRYSEGIFFEDLVFTYRSLLEAESLRFVRKPLYFNRRARAEATTFVQSDRVFDALTAMQQLDDFLASDPAYRVLDEAFAAFRFRKLNSYVYKNDANHIEPFYAALREHAKSPALDNNEYLSEGDAEQLRRVREHGLLEYLVQEVWDQKTKRYSLQRQRTKLKAERQRLKDRNSELERRLARAPGRRLEQKVKTVLRPVVRRVRPYLAKMRA